MWVTRISESLMLNTIMLRWLLKLLKLMRFCVFNLHACSVRDVLESRRSGLDFVTAIKVLRDAARGMDFLHKWVYAFPCNCYMLFIAEASSICFPKRETIMFEPNGLTFQKTWEFKEVVHESGMHACVSLITWLNILFLDMQERNRASGSESCESPHWWIWSKFLSLVLFSVLCFDVYINSHINHRINILHLNLRISCRWLKFQ